MNTGKRNRRITLVTLGALTDDGLGGFTEGVKTTRNTWCSAKQLSMRERLSYGLETSTAAYEFGFTYYSIDDITRVNELIYESRNFRIHSINEVDEVKKDVIIIAYELL